VRDTVNTALEEARRIEGEVTLHAGYRHRVRVPGQQIGACKQAADDVEPCILVESFYLLNGAETLHERVLCREVVFLGETHMVQSISRPCAVTGAILWLETTGPVICKGRE
jgi:hypothetical protein